MGYILITPLKNELEHISQLKKTVLNQTILPKLWVIVDSQSNDGSFLRAKEAFKDHRWIYIIKQRKFFEEGYSHMNFALAVNEGHEFAKKLSIKKEIDYEYIGKIDANIILSENYFEVLLLEMEQNPRLAFICGTRNNGKRGKLTLKLNNDKLIGFNDIRLYKRCFLEDMKGYPINYSPDTILLIKALNRGYEINISNKTYFIKKRRPGTKIGVWNGCILKGKAMYALGYHPLLLTINAIYLSFHFSRPQCLLAVYYGYIFGAVKRLNKATDQEIINYFSKRRFREIFRIALKIISN